MEQRRLKLHEILCEILGSRFCYFSPPNGFEMNYPCIVYELSNIDEKKADNIGYNMKVEYTITVIDENPDTDLVEKVLELPYCRFDRKFDSDNLNHFVFSLYY